MKDGLNKLAIDDLKSDVVVVKKVSVLDWETAQTELGAKWTAWRLGNETVAKYHGLNAARDFDYLEDVKIGWPDKDEVIRSLIETYRYARRWLAI